MSVKTWIINNCWDQDKKLKLQSLTQKVILSQWWGRDTTVRETMMMWRLPWPGSVWRTLMMIQELLPTSSLTMSMRTWRSSKAQLRCTVTRTKIFHQRWSQDAVTSSMQIFINLFLTIHHQGNSSQQMMTLKIVCKWILKLNYPSLFRQQTAAADDYEHISSLLPASAETKLSDSGSVDSHNDSGYGTRMGQSSSSPDLTDSDTHVHHHHHHHHASPYYSQVTQFNPYIYTNNSVIISPSSLV